MRLPGGAALICLATALLLTTACQTGGTLGGPVAAGQKSMEAMSGASMDALIEQFGMPDSIEPAPYSSSKKSEGEAPSLVLTYTALKKRVYVSQQRVVLSVTPIKE
jgi:hypothetical protein